MPLIKSISGIRGTIGGKQGDNLTPFDIVKFTAAYSIFLQQKNPNLKSFTVVVGRDSRVSGTMVNNLVCGTLLSMGINVIDIDLSTTPTVEMKVLHSNANGGIIITASHNPFNWNALKLLNNNGEFLSGNEGQTILELADSENFSFVSSEKIGKYCFENDAINEHIKKILSLNLVDVDAISKANFKVVIDCVNSTGGLALLPLLKSLGVHEIIPLFEEPTGVFPHNPEPLPEHLSELAQTVKQKHADVGFAVDPDVDRLAIIQEDGYPFGEEYTLVSVADYVLQNTKGNTVSNLSSTQALQIITEQKGGIYAAAAVGEINVVEKMKEMHAVIGGEGNGGIIYPELHYGRDALVGIALFLSYLAKTKKTCSQLRNIYPDFFISKNKIELDPNINIDLLFQHIKSIYKKEQITDIDGIRITFENQWIHLRKSNTEPIIRIYAESDNETTAKHLAEKIMNDIKTFNHQNY